jgi:hypothetical protein
MNGNAANRKQNVYDLNTPEGRALWEEIRSHFTQRPVVEIRLARLKAVALCEWLTKIENEDYPDPELWRNRAQRIVAGRMQRQLETRLQSTTSDPIMRLSRSEALVLGEWANRDDLFERLTGERSSELLALWDIYGRLEHELFVEYSDPKYDAYMERAREEVLRDRDVDGGPEP